MCDDLANRLEQIAGELRQRPYRCGWIDQFRAGDVLTTAAAADVADVDRETIRRWCEAADRSERPLGFFISASSLWLVDLPELLRRIEERRGKHDRLVAEDRARKYVEMWSTPQLSKPNVVNATRRPLPG